MRRGAAFLRGPEKRVSQGGDQVNIEKKTAPRYKDGGGDYKTKKNKRMGTETAPTKTKLLQSVTESKNTGSEKKIKATHMASEKAGSETPKQTRGEVSDATSKKFVLGRRQQGQEGEGGKTGK